jgi:hypothetical protein
VSSVASIVRPEYQLRFQDSPIIVTPTNPEMGADLFMSGLAPIEPRMHVARLRGGGKIVTCFSGVD